MSGFGFPSSRMAPSPDESRARHDREAKLRRAIGDARAEILSAGVEVEAARDRLGCAAGEALTGKVDELAVGQAEHALEAAERKLRRARAAYDYLAPRAPGGNGT